MWPSMFVVEANGTIRDASGAELFTGDPDGSIRDSSGKILIFGKERFINEICLGGHCFICGVAPKGDAAFNREHIVPRWILDFTKQFDGSLRLPNQTLFKNYGAYTIPCCVACNTGLSDAFESVLSPLFRGGYKALRQHLEANGPVVIFRWLALMYLKTHLRDARLVWERDQSKKNNAKIGDLYDWDVLHHVHCIARSHYTGIDFDTRRIGSMVILPADVRADPEKFDYAANYLGRTIMIRIGEIVCFAVLNDASIVLAHFPRARQLLENGAPLTQWQIRELHCEFTYRSWCLETRPRFSTIPIPQPHFETVLPPYVEFAPVAELPSGEKITYGELLHYASTDYFEGMPQELRAEAEARVLSGTATWFKDSAPVWPVSTPTQEPAATGEKGKRTTRGTAKKTRASTKPRKADKPTKPKPKPKPKTTTKRAPSRRSKRGASKR